MQFLSLCADDTLAQSLFQFIGDGIGSVAAFIGGMLNTLAVFPEEQEKVYSEIIEVIGPNREPAIEDKPRMSYTNAVLNECVRTSRFLFFLPSLECTSMDIFHCSFIIEFNWSAFSYRDHLTFLYRKFLYIHCSLAANLSDKF